MSSQTRRRIRRRLLGADGVAACAGCFTPVDDATMRVLRPAPGVILPGCPACSDGLNLLRTPDDLAYRRYDQERERTVGSSRDVLVRALSFRDGPACFYCHGLFGELLTIDHFIPVKQGGSDLLPNLRLACGPCNVAKGDRRMQPGERCRNCTIALTCAAGSASPYRRLLAAAA